MLIPKFLGKVANKNVPTIFKSTEHRKTSAKLRQTYTTSEQRHFLTVFIQAVLSSLRSGFNVP